jgi:serine/threonine-protein kinase
MTLSAGTKLGPYEILSPLGAGGMGEVYRARDPRMGRDVAIKLSAEKFSDRFGREVHAVAALNHPNICHIYDVGSNYLVMELVEGPTLANRIQQGAIPLDEALPLARQIADALEAAHEKGIVHRDLKPANIKIKADGAVKVLDFGLAKIAEPATAAATPDVSPTLTIEATRKGQILGTAAYMAPEQARGKPVDKRADIWAFGVVLYEMLTGRRLFGGETVSDTLAGVLAKEPDWQRVPPRAQPLLKRCLEKDPKRRLRDIGDACPILEDSALPTAKNRLPWVFAGALAVALTVTVALWIPLRYGPRRAAPLHSVEPPAVRLDLDLGADVSPSTTGPAVVLSPDGTRLVFVSQSQGGRPRLFSRRLNDPKATQIPGAEGAHTPFFSPDGQWIGFFAQGKLKKVRVDGGEPVSLCDAPSGRGASWGEDGNIIAALDPQQGLSLVPSDGGKVVSLTELGVGENSHRWPQVLPGSKAVLFSVSTEFGNFDRSGIAVVDLISNRRKTVFEHAGMYARYLPSGHLVYVTKGVLFAVRFDANRLEVQGAAAAMDEISSNQNIGSAQLDFSRTGILAYRGGRTEGLKTLQWLDAEGKTTSLWNEEGAYFSPALSPDGTRLALQVNQESGGNLWIYDWQRGSKTRLTNGVIASNPVWSPNGRFLVMRSTTGMAWVGTDGAGNPQPLTQGRTLQVPTAFTPDGQRLVYGELTPGAGAAIRWAPIESGSGELRIGKPELFVRTSSLNISMALSPDGRWLAYADSRDGIYEVYVRSFPGAGARIQISNAGGTTPFWSRNTHQLFYRTEDQRIMVVNYTVNGDSFKPEMPRVWFDKRLANVGLAGNIDLAPDGKRFVVLMSAESPEPRESASHVKLMINFFDEVGRRVARQAK